jgi:DNA polymerase
MSHHNVILSGENDWSGFRREARALLAGLVPPEDASWQTRAAMSCDSSTGPLIHQGQGGAQLVLPRSFVTLCETAILHSSPERFGLLYRLLWRLMHEPELPRNPLDPDRVRALHMAQAVRRDIQKLKTRIRFRTISEDRADAPLHLAWFEPDHHVLEAVAPFFARRFGDARWAILTPERSVRDRDGHLEFGSGVQMDGDASALSGDVAVWLEAYDRAFVTRRASEALRSDRGSATERSFPQGSAS